MSDQSWKPAHVPGSLPLSVVISTFNRGDLLAEALESLTRQTLDTSEFEVVIINDGSSDNTREVVEGFSGRLPIRYIYQHNTGLASARNHGIFASQGNILLSFDDDDIAHPSLLEQHLETHHKYPDHRFAVLGYTELGPAIADSPLMQFVTETGRFMFSYPLLRDEDIVDYTYFWGGRTSCKRLFLLQNGVFNPVFRFGCEDIELGYRLSKHGFRVIFNRKAVSTMIRDIDFDGFCQRLIRQGRSNYVFSRMHPDKEIESWAETFDAKTRWDKVSASYDAILNSARQLDKFVNMQVAAGLELDELTENLLHRAYFAAFRLCKLKGITEKIESDGPADSMTSH